MLGLKKSINSLTGETAKMTNKLQRALFLSMAVAIATVGTVAVVPQAQAQSNYRYNRPRLDTTINRLQENADDFRSALDDALDERPANGTDREDRINEIARDFTNAIDRLNDNFDRNRSSSSDADQVLQLGRQLDRVVQRRRWGRDVENRWSEVRQDLSELSTLTNNTSRVRF